MSSISEFRMKAASSNICTNFIVTWIFPGFSLFGGNTMLPTDCLLFRVHREVPSGAVMFLSCSNNSKVYLWFHCRMVQPAYSGTTFGRVIFGLRLFQSSFPSARIATSPFSQPSKPSTFKIYFTYPYQEAHAQFLKLSLMLQSYNLRIFGPTFRVPLLSHPTELINI